MKVILYIYIYIINIAPISSFSPEINNEWKNSLKFIFWKHNPENNIKFLTKEMKNIEKSFERVSFYSDWLKEFNIGNIMFLSQIDLEKFDLKASNIISKSDFVIELILYFA